MASGAFCTCAGVGWKLLLETMRQRWPVVIVFCKSDMKCGHAIKREAVAGGGTQCRLCLRSRDLLVVAESKRAGMRLDASKRAIYLVKKIIRSGKHVAPPSILTTEDWDLAKDSYFVFLFVFLFERENIRIDMSEATLKNRVYAAFEGKPDEQDVPVVLLALQYYKEKVPPYTLPQASTAKVRFCSSKAEDPCLNRIRKRDMAFKNTQCRTCFHKDLVAFATSGRRGGDMNASDEEIHLVQYLVEKGERVTQQATLAADDWEMIVMNSHFFCVYFFVRFSEPIVRGTPIHEMLVLLETAFHMETQEREEVVTLKKSLAWFKRNAFGG
jgi:hypothetical protein